MRNVTVTLSDGKTHTYNNVPDNVTPEQVKARAQSEYPGVQVTNIDGGATSAAPQEQKEPGFLSRLGDIFTGSLRKTKETESLPDWASMPELNQFTLESAKTGLGTLLSSPEETVKIIQAQFPNTKVRQDEKGNYIVKSGVDGKEYAIKPGFQLSDIPRALGAIGAFTPAGSARTLAGAVAGGAGTQAAIEGSQALAGGEINPDEIALAGAIPGAFQAARGASQAAKAIKNTTIDGPSSQLIQEAGQRNIPLMTSDVLPPETFVGKSAQFAGERIPVAGTGATRQAQQQSRVSAIQDLAKEYGADVPTKFDVEIANSLLSKRSEDLTKYKNLKGEVFNRLDSAGAVPTPNAIGKIDSEIARLEGLGDAVPVDAIRTLQNFRNSIQGKSINNLEDVRKLLGDQLTSPELASSRTILEKIPSAVYRELNKDLESFIRANGDPRDLTKWKVANGQLSKLANEASNAKLKTALNRGQDTPETINALLFSKNRSDVQTLYKNLSNQGRENARSAIVQRAIMESGGIENVSTNKFLTQMNKLQDQTGIFFSKEQKQQMDGLVRVLEATRRAGDAAVAPATGAQLSIPVGAAALTQAMGGIIPGLATGGSIGLLARGYESPAVRDLLIRVAKAPKGSKQEQRYLSALVPFVIQAKNSINEQEAQQ